MRIKRLVTETSRPELVRAVEAAELYSRFTLQGPVRTLEQNKLMWRLLSCYADQVEHFGRKYDEEAWKCIGLKALGRSMEFIPGFDAIKLGNARVFPVTTL